MANNNIEQIKKLLAGFAMALSNNQISQEEAEQYAMSYLQQMSQAQGMAPRGAQPAFENGGKIEYFIKKYSGGGSTEKPNKKSEKKEVSRRERTDMTETYKTTDGTYRPRGGEAIVTDNGDGSTSYTLTRNGTNSTLRGKDENAGTYNPKESSTLTISPTDTTGVYHKSVFDAPDKTTYYVTKYQYDKLPWWKRRSKHIIPSNWMYLFKNNFPELN